MLIKEKSCLLPSILVLLAVGCASPPPEPEPEPATVRVENPDMGIAIAAVPAPFEVAENSGETLVFRAAGPAGEGELEVKLGPVETSGINLVEAVKVKRAEFEGMAGGEYYGNRELGTPIGTAFTARGAYDTEAGRIEESWIFAIHPMENRVLMLRYAYPDGEGQERVGGLMEIMGEIEGLSRLQPVEDAPPE